VVVDSIGYGNIKFYQILPPDDQQYTLFHNSYRAEKTQLQEQKIGCERIQ
jgi:hypothetical protein